MTAADVRTALAAAAATLLGALALSPVLSSNTWVRPVVEVLLVVLVTGLALRFAGGVLVARAFRDRPVPTAVAALGAVLVPVGQLVAGTGHLVRRFTDVGGVLPTPAGVEALGAVLRDGMDEVTEQVAPALPVASLTALVVVLVGLVGVLVDLLAVAARQGAVAGLLLLVLLGVPVFTVSGDIGLLPVAAVAAGFALLLWADQAGRLEAAGPVCGPRSSGGSTALRIGGLAVLVGLLGGGVLPTLAEGTMSGGEGGGSTGTRLDPVAAMYGELTRNDPIDLLRLDTPLPDPGYLRAVTIDRYDSEAGWTLTDPEAQLPLTSQLPTGHDAESGRAFDATLEAIGHDDRFLPVPVSPRSVDMVGGENGWRFDPVTDTVVGRDVTSQGRRYEVSGSEVRPSPEQLQAAPALPEGHPDRVRFTALPDDLDPRVTAQVQDLVDGVDGGYDRVRRILDFLTDGANDFRYALSTAPGTSGDDLVDFLTERQGYCEQYAGAMAVMVRAAGMPARVALGYTPGTVQEDGTRLITSSDAHAWVEVFFVDLGWVPFDPTPIDVTRRADLPWAPRVTTEELPEQTPELQPEIPPELLLLDPQYPLVPGGEATDGPVPDAAPAAQGSWAAPVGLALLVVAAAAAPAAARALQRRLRLSRGTTPALWDELTATADDLGLARDPAWTPREAGRALAARTGPEGAAPIGRLARAEELAGYGPATAAQEDGLDAALRLARRELRAAVSRRARLRAAFWPASLPGAVRAGMPAWTRGWAEMRRSRRPGGRRLRAGDAGS